MKKSENKTTIEVRGEAERTVIADTAEYGICFVAKDLYLSKAIEMVDKHCEIFLNEIEKLGIDVKEIMLVDDDLDEETTRENNTEKVVKRSIYFQTNVNAAFNNALLDIVQSNDLNVKFSVRYSYEKQNEVEEELMKEAVINSKKMAELIAEASQQKVVGIYSASNNSYRKLFFYESDDDEIDDEDIPRVSLFEKSRKKSDDLAAREITISKSMNIEWLVE